MPHQETELEKLRRNHAALLEIAESQAETIEDLNKARRVADQVAHEQITDLFDTIGEQAKRIEILEESTLQAQRIGDTQNACIVELRDALATKQRLLSEALELLVDEERSTAGVPV